MRRKVLAAIDLHSGTSVLGWRSVKGEMLGEERFVTNEENLLHWVRQIKAREVHLTIEAGPLTRWAVKKVLEPAVPKLIVCDPHYNRLVSKNAHKGDEVDVASLSELLRLEALHPVWMGPDEDRDVFRAAVSNLLNFRDQQRELKGLIKCRYQEQGILRINGREVFHPEKRKEWIEKIAPERQHGFLLLYDLFDAALGAWTEQLGEVIRLGKAYPEIERFMEVPGIGEIGAHVFCAIIQDPHRFNTHQQLWRYCCLGITSRTSDGKPLGYERLDRRGRRELKTVSYHAWRTAVRANQKCDVIRRFYMASKERTGTPRHGRLNTQRKILKTLWTMWKTGSHFDPNLFLQTPNPEPAGRRRRRRRRPRRTRSQKG